MQHWPSFDGKFDRGLASLDDDQGRPVVGVDPGLDVGLGLPLCTLDLQFLEGQVRLAKLLLGLLLAPAVRRVRDVLQRLEDCECAAAPEQDLEEER